MTLQYSLIQIEAFTTVCECGNFTRAAARLHKDRTTISELVQSLELDLGYSLFQRQKRTFELTPQGELLYRQARLFLLEAQAFNQIVSQLGQPGQHRLTISYDVFAPRAPLLPLTDWLNKQGIHLDLVCQSRNQAEAGMLAGTVDIGIYQANNRSINGQFRWRAVYTLALAVYAHKDYFTQRPVSLLALASSVQLVPWLDMTQELTQRLQIADRLQVVSEPELLIALLAEKQGWAFLPVHWQADKHSDVDVITTEMGNGNISHTMVMLWKPGEKAHPALSGVLDKISELMA